MTALYPPLYYVVVSDVRYRYPVLWITLLAAGFGIREAVALLARRFSRAPAPGTPR